MDKIDASSKKGLKKISGGSHLTEFLFRFWLNPGTNLAPKKKPPTK